MVVPARPVPNFVVGQTGLAFGPLNAFFDSMLGFGHAREFFQRRFRRFLRYVLGAKSRSRRAQVCQPNLQASPGVQGNLSLNLGLLGG